MTELLERIILNHKEMNLSAEWMTSSYQIANFFGKTRVIVNWTKYSVMVMSISQQFLQSTWPIPDETMLLHQTGKYLREQFIAGGRGEKSLWTTNSEPDEWQEYRVAQKQTMELNE